MRRQVRPAEVFLGNLRVDLGRRDRGVAEQLLDDPDVGAVVEKMRGERMAQHVRRDPVRQPDAPRAQVLTTVQTACRLIRRPRVERNIACASARARRLLAAMPGLPPGPSQAARAARAKRPTGTMRSFEPLPRTRTMPPGASRSAIDSPASSEMRIPVA